MYMQKLSIAAVMLVASTQAFSFQCPGDVKAVDAALSSTSVSGDAKAAVMNLRDAGTALHKAGKHQEAVDSLAIAKSLLGI